MNWLCREVPEELKPAKGIINGVILGIFCWLVIIAIMMLCVCKADAFMRDDWSKTDTALLVASTTLHVIDWGQTLDIARNPDRFKENTNFLLGEHPSVGRVNTVMLSGLVIQTVVPMITPKKYRWLWWSVWIGGKGYLVMTNYSAGIRVRFR